MKWLLLICLLFSLNQFAEAETYQEWWSGYDDVGGRHFAATMDPTDNSTAFFIWQKEGECDGSYVELIVTGLEERKEELFKAEFDTLLMKVDKNKPVRAIYNLLYRKTNLYIEAQTYFSGADNLSSQLTKGLVLKVKINFGESDFYNTFSLKGSREAIFEMQEACESTKTDVMKSEFDEWDI